MEQEATTWMHAMEGWFNYYVPEMVRNILPAILALIAIIIAHKITKRLIVKAMQHQKREDADIRQLQSLLKYAFMLTGIVFVIASLSGSLAAMGLTAAFLSMVLGWSLQRPVTGVAAWLMVMIKRPFQIGDRIIIQGVRGDVLDISPTHVLLGEVGGTVGGEESSNRGILIPNAVLFDQMVTNYAVSEESKYILDEVPVRVSYDSDYQLAQQTLINCATEVTSRNHRGDRPNAVHPRGVFRFRGIYAAAVSIHSSRATAHLQRYCGENCRGFWPERSVGLCLSSRLL